VSSVVVFGSTTESSELAELIQRQLRLSVDVVNPLESAASGSRLTASSEASPGRYAAGIGMLSELVSKDRRTIDFVNPRRPAEPVSKTRRFLLPGAIAATIALATVATIWWKLSTIDSRIAELRAQIQSAKPALDKAQARIAEVDLIETWAKSDVQWLTEIERLSRDLPVADQIRISQLQCQIDTSSGDGTMTIEGLSNAPDSVRTMEQNLAGDKRTVRGDDFRHDARDPRYKFHFKEIVSIDNDVPEMNRRRRGARNNNFGSIGAPGR
jgi:hypothetical protein